MKVIFYDRSSMVEIPHKFIISYFDNKFGPMIILNDLEDPNYSAESYISEETIAQLMDLKSDKEYHYYYFKRSFSWHFHFEIDDPAAQGGKHILMVSVVFEKPRYLTEEDYVYSAIKKKKEFKWWLTTLSTIIKEDPLFNSLLRRQQIRMLRDPIMNAEVKNTIVKTLIKQSNSLPQFDNDEISEIPNL